jgi:hypothetical protein
MPDGLVPIWDQPMPVTPVCSLYLRVQLPTSSPALGAWSKLGNRSVVVRGGPKLRGDVPQRGLAKRSKLRHDSAVAFATFEATHFAGVPAVDKGP